MGQNRAYPYVPSKSAKHVSSDMIKDAMHKLVAVHDPTLLKRVRPSRRFGDGRFKNLFKSIVVVVVVGPNEDSQKAKTDLF